MRLFLTLARHAASARYATLARRLAPTRGITPAAQVAFALASLLWLAAAQAQDTSAAPDSSPSGQPADKAAPAGRGESAPSVSLPPRELLHVYLLTGQSNMAGRGIVGPEDRVPHPRVIMLDKQGRWQPAIDPLHGDKSNAGVGLGSQFGRAMAEANPEVTIALVPCAVGGSPLSRWEREGDLYQRALQRAKIASQAGTIKGVLWHQGENDSQREALAATYAERLAKMVKDLRADLGDDQLPFVVGELGRFREIRDTSPRGVVQAALRNLPQQVEQTRCVSSETLKALPDGIHFDSPSLREFGRRYAQAMQELQSQPAESQPVESRPQTPEQSQPPQPEPPPAR